MRQAYDYWQDQPGSYYNSDARAGSSSPFRAASFTKQHYSAPQPPPRILHVLTRHITRTPLPFPSARPGSSSSSSSSNASHAASFTRQCYSASPPPPPPPPPPPGSGSGQSFYPVNQFKGYTVVAGLAAAPPFGPLLLQSSPTRPYSHHPAQRLVEPIHLQPTGP